MALCDKTLQQWLKERDDSTSQQTITTIFTQILRGVDHIHSLGMVHHDIKVRINMVTRRIRGYESITFL